ncbi:MAG: pilus assembly protein N-terminal domain-containing protein [Robiginitomaculum sp.]|nr:pilus assembly protein N-terminal domain-containing protein [Robiginitomaculum sp.]
MNKTQILHLPSAASTIIVGNPDIADISVHSPNTIFIIGRGYGQTNLIALDAQGQTILQANITVKSTNTRFGVRVINIGAGQESYHCAPNCLPTPILGDSPDFIGRYSAIGGAINNLSAGPVSNTASGQVQAALNAIEANSPPPQYFEGMGQSIRAPRELGEER